MRRIKVLALAVMALCVFGAFSASNALAEETLLFEATGMGKLLSHAVNNQAFKTAAGTVECEGLKQTAGEAGLKTHLILAVIEYEKCTAFGFVVAKISLADYLFHTNGKVSVDKLIKIEVPSDFNCEISVSVQKELGTVVYNNINPGTGKGDVEVLANVTGIKSKGANGCAYAEEKAGTYTGNSLVELPGFEIKA